MILQGLQKNNEEQAPDLVYQAYDEPLTEARNSLKQTLNVLRYIFDKRYGKRP